MKFLHFTNHTKISFILVPSTTNLSHVFFQFSFDSFTHSKHFIYVTVKGRFPLLLIYVIPFQLHDISNSLSSHLSLITLQESLYLIYSKYYFHAIVTVICVFNLSVTLVQLHITTL